MGIFDIVAKFVSSNAAAIAVGTVATAGALGVYTYSAEIADGFTSATDYLGITGPSTPSKKAKKKAKAEKQAKLEKNAAKEAEAFAQALATAAQKEMAPLIAWEEARAAAGRETVRSAEQEAAATLAKAMAVATALIEKDEAAKAEALVVIATAVAAKAELAAAAKAAVVPEAVEVKPRRSNAAVPRNKRAKPVAKAA